MMSPVDSRHAAWRDTIRRAFAHTTSCPPQIVCGTRAAHCGRAISPEMAQISGRVVGGGGRQWRQRRSGGGGIVAGQGDVVGIDIMTDGRTDDDDNVDDGYRTRATTQR